MQIIPDTRRPISLGTPPSEGRDIKTSIDNKQYYKDLVNKANSVSLINILGHYGIKISSQNKNIICPLPKHKGGKESSPSFNYYPDTNSFYCFGCKSGIYATDFVALIENIHRIRAASKILQDFAGDVEFELNHNNINYSDRLEIIMGFSNFIRESLRENMTNNLACLYIEKVCEAYDQINEKYVLDNEASKSLVEKMIGKIKNYLRCQ